jgi:hypothetical protein
MSATEIETTGVPLPRISQIRVLPNFRLTVIWADGSRAGNPDTIDLAPVINTYKFYRPLRKNEELFQTAHLIDDGNAVAWGDGAIDMSAELIEDIAKEAMTPKEFAEFLERNKLTQEAVATILGYSRRQIGYYLSGDPIPRVVALACYGYEVASVLGRAPRGEARHDRSADAERQPAMAARTQEKTLALRQRKTTILTGSDKVGGTPVYRSDGDRVGQIERIMIDKLSGKVVFAVMSFGGFMGIGQDYYPLPWSLLTYNPRLEGYEINISEQQLMHAPKYSNNETWDWSDQERGKKVYAYYGVVLQQALDTTDV